MAQAAAKLQEWEPKKGVNLYNAACAYGQPHALVVKNKPTPVGNEEAERQKYINLSLACLKEAIAAGYKNFDHIKRDEDLIALHGLPEFENLFPSSDKK